MSDTHSHIPIPSAQRSSLRWILAVPLLLCVVSIGLWSALVIQHMTRKQPLHRSSTEVPMVAAVDEADTNAQTDIAVLFSGSYAVEQVSAPAAGTLDGYPPKLLAALQGISDQQLIALRCSDRIVNEYGRFFIREAHTHAVSRQVVEDPYAGILQAVLQSVPATHTLLTARFCETEKGNLLLEYSTGIQQGHHPDAGNDVTAYLAYIERGKPFTSGISMLQYDVWPYPGCRKPLRMTRDGVVYYECGLVTGAEVNATYHRIDFREGDSEQVGKCVYTYTGGPKKTCTE